ncbi:PepSY domain-containing protein [Pontiella sulfatireligans]|uniref:PepSY domain-containing protein n=1 Tax=Pontiella sulfatireligans TaxID=2750658 RepID=A0A6C2UL83_9BACT|nr:PepSY domain-containing protein [Pontiella sulfatireligans]VGO20990.1 hypothetical protein SCARR_03059 [Pontiella sulfatireligans]
MSGKVIRLGLAALAVGAVSAWAGGKAIKADQLPAAVVAAANAACPGGTIKDIEKEKDDGAVVYEVEMTAGGKGCDLKIAADGTVLETEQQVAVEDLPKKVQATLASFANAAVKKAELVKEKDAAALYEINIVMTGQAMELKINEKGQIIELETKGKKKGEKEDDD